MPKIDTLMLGGWFARLIGVFLTIVVILLVFGKELTDTGDMPLVITNVTVIDAVSGVREAQDVTISAGRIVGVVPVGGILPDDARTIDGTGKFLIPGLWDAHVHVAYDEAIDYRTFFPLSLAHGITYLRDTGGHLDRLAPAIEAAKNPRSPDVWFSGPLIDGAERVYDGSSPFYPDISVSAATVDDAVAIVDAHAAAGASFIKAYEMLAPDVFSAVVKRAGEHGLKVAAHVPLSMAVDQVVNSGAADLQHLRNLEFACAQDPEVLQSERQDMLVADLLNEDGEQLTAAARRIAIHQAQRTRALEAQSENGCTSMVTALARAGVAQTPTLTIATFFTRRLFADPAWRATFKLMPESVRAGWETRSKRLIDRAASDDEVAHVDWIKSMLPQLAAAGVPIIAGTDAPIAYLTPGASLHEELNMLVDAGLTPMQALAAATVEPARFLGLEGEMGAIGSDYRADVVLLNANPLEDISNTLAIEAVIKGGLLLERAELDVLMAQPSGIK